MSLKTFISKLWAEIKNIFDDIPAELKNAIHIGVVITENIKAFADSPAADVLTAIIPGDLDDDIKNLLRAKLPTILIELKLADSCGDMTDPAEIVKCAITVLQGLSGDIKSAFLHDLSIFIANVVADGKLSWSDGVYLSEWYYQNNIKNIAY